MVSVTNATEFQMGNLSSLLCTERPSAALRNVPFFLKGNCYLEKPCVIASRYIPLYRQQSKSDFQAYTGPNSGGNEGNGDALTPFYYTNNRWDLSCPTQFLLNTGVNEGKQYAKHRSFFCTMRRVTFGRAHLSSLKIIISLLYYLPLPSV